MTSILTINDNSLTLQQGENIITTQGYAWLKDDDVLFDSQFNQTAIKNSRLFPQQINSRYWQYCEQSAIPTNEAGMRTSADLIWRHLSQIEQDNHLDDLIIVVPSHYQTSNLQLLLGICKTCKINVVGVINKSILRLKNQVYKESQSAIHVDLQLHQTVVSKLSLHNNKLVLQEVDVLSDVSIHAMIDALLKSMQQRFIQADRFDPLHHAETEQQLFDQLSRVESELAIDGKTNLEVMHDSRLYTVAFDRDMWASCLKPFVEHLLRVREASTSNVNALQLNQAFSSLEVMGLSNDDYVILDESNLPPVSDVTNLVIGQEINKYIVELDVVDSKQATGKAANKKTSKSTNKAKATAKLSNQNQDSLNATHLLHAGVAVPIQKAKIETASGQLVLSLAKTSEIQAQLNDQTLFIINEPDRKDIHCNDRIGSNIADGAITAIKIVDGD